MKVLQALKSREVIIIFKDTNCTKVFFPGNLSPVLKGRLQLEYLGKQCIYIYLKFHLGNKGILDLSFNFISLPAIRQKL